MILWDRPKLPAPVTGAMSEPGRRTFEFKCRVCQMHWKRGEGELITILFALAEMQGIAADDDAPISLDPSLLERA